jgi:hypothetical protein
MRHHLDGVDGDDVAGEHTRESFWMCLDGICDIGIVMSIAGRRLDERGLLHARAILLHDHLLNAHGPIPRPGGLMAADWRARIAQRIGGDDMWMDVDDFSSHRVSGRSISRSRTCTPSLHGAVLPASPPWTGIPAGWASRGSAGSRNSLNSGCHTACRPCQALRG